MGNAHLTTEVTTKGVQNMLHTFDRPSTCGSTSADLAGPADAADLTGDATRAAEWPG